jgi:hypothetical protein
MFAIDEHTRYVFVEFMKTKDEALTAIKAIVAAFDATVATPTDEHGRARPRPRVREVHSDREGKLMSHLFREFCASSSIHHTTSPPHDHDLNPIAERVIGLISENASTIRSHGDIPISFWPHIVANAVDWHNSLVTSTGSSTAEAQISPHQRLTHRPPSVMDLPALGCMAVVRKPPTHLAKTSLADRGMAGKFLGRSLKSKGCYDVAVDGKIWHSSSVLVDEERFPWSPPDRRHRPLTSISHAARQPLEQPLVPSSAPGASVASSPAAATGALRLLNLFSGPYYKPCRARRRVPAGLRAPRRPLHATGPQHRIRTGHTWSGSRSGWDAPRH